MSKNSSLNTTIGTTQFSSGPVTVVTFAAPAPSGPSDHHTRTPRSVRLHFHCTSLATVLPLHYTGNCASLALQWHFTCNCTSLATALHLHFTGNCASIAFYPHWQLRFHCTTLATALSLQLCFCLHLRFPHVQLPTSLSLLYTATP